ncbi:MAG: hypothetical protein ACIALR_03265, partial [Blastopirellula sp. JB062]
MNQPKKSHWASLAAALGAAPSENLSDQPSSDAPVADDSQETEAPAEEKNENLAASAEDETAGPVAELESEAETEEPAAEVQPTKRHWAGLAQSLGLPVERLFGKF